MSTVKTTNLQHPSASDVGITLGSDGSVVLPQGFTGGIGSNVVSTAKLDAFTTASATYVDITGLNVNITPSSATSKVLVLVQLTADARGTVQSAIQLRRDSTDILVSTDGSTDNATLAAGFFRNVSFGDSHQTYTFSFLDSPATTSVVNYTVRIRTDSGGTWYVNRTSNNVSGGTSTITAIEVAA